MPDERDSNENNLLELRVWLRLLACVNLAEGQLRRKFRDRFNTTLARFDVLAQLDRMPVGHSLSELSRQLMVTNGNLTPLIDRLVGDGLVERSPSVTDRRVQHVQLTTEGRRVLSGMIPAHNAWISEIIGGLGVEDQSRLHALLGELKKSILKAGGDAVPTVERGEQDAPLHTGQGQPRISQRERPEAGR